MTIAEKVTDTGKLFARIEQLIARGRPGAARPLLMAARGLDHAPAEISVLAARVALSDGLLEGAEADLDEAVSAAPTHPGLRKCRAQLRGRLGDMEGAARDAAEAVVLDRRDPEAKALLGEALLHLGRTSEAVTCLIEASAAASRNVVFREKLAQALIADGDMEGALDSLLDGIAVVPEATSFHNAAIVLCIRLRDFGQATDLAERARARGAADASTFALKGHALSSLGRHDEATEAYQEALKLAPGDAHIRLLATSSAMGHEAPDAFIRTLFDGYADRFEEHLIELGYRIPGLIRRYVTDFSKLGNIGPVLDLGCGTGLVALALSDLELGPFTGVDVSPRMLERARAKELYATLTEAALPGFLREKDTAWRLILAADVMCYFGPLEEMFDAVRARLRRGGRFVFSVEELLPGHDGDVPGNGYWAPGRLGRYAHAPAYLAQTAEARGFRCIALDREILRYEAGGPVDGLMMVLERRRDDA
jgi:predicted TPR repeat methyltransferase